MILLEGGGGGGAFFAVIVDFSCPSKVDQLEFNVT